MQFYDFAEPADTERFLSADVLAVGLYADGTEVVLQWGVKQRVLSEAQVDALVTALLLALEEVSVRRIAETN
jgi:hypothetical protein